MLSAFALASSSPRAQAGVYLHTFPVYAVGALCIVMCVHTRTGSDHEGVTPCCWVMASPRARCEQADRVGLLNSLTRIPSDRLRTDRLMMGRLYSRQGDRQTGRQADKRARQTMVCMESHTQTKRTHADTDARTHSTHRIIDRHAFALMKPIDTYKHAYVKSHTKYTLRNMQAFTQAQLHTNSHTMTHTCTHTHTH